MNENYATLYFSKSLTDISEPDLVRFFSTERDESDTVEYKSYFEKGQNNHAHKEAAVLKTICAFLNSSGGLLVWGAPIGEKPEGRTVKIFIGKLSPVSELIEKDTFISRVANRIRPANNQIRMHRVDMTGGGYVYLFDVQQSTFKPHQFDDRYWVRHDGQTGIAPHYLIDALFKQIRYPNLGGYIKFRSCTRRQEMLYLHMEVYVLNHSKTQNEFDSYFLLTSSQPFIVDNNSGATYALNNHQIIREEMKILSYSHGTFHPVVLSVSTSRLIERPTEPINMMLNFGGKTSPMKRSDYTLTFRGFGNLQYAGTDSIKNLFTIGQKVNIDMNDIEIDEDQRVRLLLDR